MKGLFAALAAMSAVVSMPASAQTAPELGHWMVAISVADLDAETAFFQKLGFKVEVDTTFGPGIPVRWLTSGSERIELLKIANSQPGPVKPKPPGHAAVQGFSQITLSTTDLEATKAALAAQGLTPALDITEVKPLGVKVMYYQDPEGNAVEIAQKLG
ncbi:MAG: VOC family protein [Candidatus Andeanibacterium colombiense]|uniref:VOC family protein n=1 Tax=Candidatus Andeanibacterium colombiense TaxID=3121345 RepID=A0AAJ5X8D0_9SPHN|nr:MAG: VOC family protein [Sphingomonadaceae bacterium]